MSSLLLFRAIAIIVLLESVLCKPELKLLHMLFRHGDKIPHREFQYYPNDPHRNHSYYPIGNGGLTNEGKMRAYKLGLMLRERYNKFLGPYYTPEEIHARSTIVPRAQATAQLVLTGLYPPVGEQIWNQNLAWQPFYTEYENPDTLFTPQTCPMYIKEYKKFHNQPEIQAMIREYDQVFSYITQHSGRLINDTKNIYYLYGLFKEEAMQNLLLPNWARKIYPDPTEEITILDFHLHSYTTNLKRLNGGLMVRKITDDIKASRSGTLTPPESKAFLLSAHETHVVALARALGLEEPILPSYTSTIIVETFQDREMDNAYFVRILLWTGVGEKLIVMKIPGCVEMCPLDEFLRLLKDVIPNDAEYRCEGAVPDETSTRINVSNQGSFVTVNVVLILVFATLFIRSSFEK